MFATALLTAAAFAAPEAPEVVPIGDIRYRDELSVTRPGDADMRFRQRVRARLKVTATAFDQLEAGLRIRTGSIDDANSPYRDLGRGFDPIELRFPLQR